MAVALHQQGNYVTVDICRGATFRERLLFSVCQFVRLVFHVGMGGGWIFNFNAVNFVRPMHLFYSSTGSSIILQIGLTERDFFIMCKSDFQGVISLFWISGTFSKSALFL